MHGERRIFLLTYMVAVAIPVSLAFNIDVTNPDVHNGEPNDFFGYKVLQFMSGGNKGIIVTAPLQLNGSGAICKPASSNHNQTTQCFKGNSSLNQMLPLKNLGLSIVQDATLSQFTVCSPSVVSECYGNSYLNSVCYKITEQLQEISSFTPAFQKCTKKTVDLVFLFDGSGSMTEAEFNKNKEFIVNIMNILNNTSIKFAAVQFSGDYSKVFDFNDYQAETALKKLKDEKHMRSLTNTHKALKFVLDDIFYSTGAGASLDATKVLVLITDGNPSDSDTGIIERYNTKNIIRFVIGVKEANLTKFNEIASAPADKYAFKIEKYDGLTGILKNFQNKIFKVEGTKVARSGDITEEMSQSGFSSVFYKDTLILGAVGSNTWRGSLQEIYEQNKTQIQDPQMMVDSYMGYSVSVGEKNNAKLYFTGAPRFNHTGQVLLFRQDDKHWRPAQRINGDQIGSYFGAELCSVDVTSDGNTDFLLVGAPLFYQPQEKREGQIYVYSLTKEMQLKRELNVTAPSMGRFGTTISCLADLNGDGLRDVAVGAPLEDDNRGAVYIYLGDRHRGIRSLFNQKILGQKINSGMRFFGQAIDGNIDLGEDGLPDIVVGSQGTAVVLRSRPVFNVTARLSFQPEEISTEKIVCPATDDDLPVVTLTACFEMVETTKSKAGAASSGPNISFTLEVDPMRQTHRGFFSESDKHSRHLTSSWELMDEYTCFNFSIYIPICVKDTLSPIVIKLNISQDDSESAGAVLNVDSKRQAVAEVPFQKKCRKNDTCIAELEVDFNFMTSTLLVAEDNYFKLSVKLSNHGDDSYNTSLTMHYPVGLSFSMMTVDKATRRTLHSCHDLEGVIDKTICGVSLPVYHSRSFATFNASFFIMTDYEWNETLSMTIIGESDNANHTGTNSLTKRIPVQFEIKMAVTVKEETITYMNFTTEDEPKEMVIIYKINNPGWKAFPVNVTLIFPTKLEHNFEMKNYHVNVTQNKTHCTENTHRTPSSPECSPMKHCKVIECDSIILDKESATEIQLVGEVQFRDLKQTAAKIGFLERYTGDSAEVKFKNFISVSYDKQRYVLDSHKQKKSDSLWKDPTTKWTEVRVEFIIPPNELWIIVTGTVLGLFLLFIITFIMFKMGCFKRKTLEYYQEQEDEAAPQDDASPDSTLFLATVPTNGTVSQSEAGSEEEKKLLDDGQANSSPPAADPEKGLD